MYVINFLFIKLDGFKFGMNEFLELFLMCFIKNWIICNFLKSDNEVLYFIKFNSVIFVYVIIVKELLKKCVKNIIFDVFKLFKIWCK